MRATAPERPSPQPPPPSTGEIRSSNPSGEHEAGRSQDADHRAEVAPADKLLHDIGCKDGEHDQVDHFLAAREQPYGGSEEIAEAVDRHRDAIFHQREALVDQ